MLKGILCGLAGGCLGAVVGIHFLLQAANDYPKTVDASPQERERFVGIVSAALVQPTAYGVLAGSAAGCAIAALLADRKPKREQIIQQWLDEQLSSPELSPIERDALIEAKSLANSGIWKR